MKRLSILVAFATLLNPRATSAQTDHNHALAVNAVGGGLPYFCAAPSATAVADGPWSNPATWSTHAVPGANAKVLIPAGQAVTYDAESSATLQCIELHGRLTFATDQNTRMKIVNLLVMDDGVLEVGTATRPIDATVRAEIQIANQPFDTQLDPGQIGNGIVGLGRVTMHGAIKSPTFARAAADVRAAQTTLVLDRAVSGWTVGDRLVIPDSRQLREQERGGDFQSRDERVEIVSIAGAQVTVTPALAWDHPGGYDPKGVTLRPHVGNLSRNIVVDSERSSGTRGHMIFLARAEVDLRYVEVRDMGRTRMGLLDSTTFDESGRTVRVGTNQIGRYAIHFHHAFGPKTPPANGYQFTLIGNSVAGAAKWGITIHNTHYGLVQDNVVYDTRGAAIVTEDGTESFNVFDHNFAVRSQGSGGMAPPSGYGGAGPDPGGDGSGFWFSGPNNYIRNNVAANADVFGFSLAGSAGTLRMPSAKGADTTREADTRPLDTARSPVLEFSNNEAYGALQIGVDCSWNGLLSHFVVWNAARNGVVGTPSDQLVIDGLVARGDPAILGDASENPTGVWLSNYIAKDIVVRNADIEGLRTGIASPFFARLPGDTAAGRGSLLIENSRFKNYFGVAVATSYLTQASGGQPSKRAVVRGSTFEPLAEVPVNVANPPAAISMNYRVAPGDAEPREPILVYDFNKKPGDTFKVYYSLEAPSRVAPCQESRADIGGWVCK